MKDILRDIFNFFQNLRDFLYEAI